MLATAGGLGGEVTPLVSVAARGRVAEQEWEVRQEWEVQQEQEVEQERVVAQAPEAQRALGVG
jgi:hypothetical protein